MSKRKAKPTPQRVGPSAKELFRRANTQLHDIRVSTPILVIIQRLTTDQKFREAVTRLFK